MENELIKTIISQGAWAVLFVWLLIDTRRESKTREERLQGIINKNQDVISELAEKFDVLENIQEDVTEIKIKIK
ncbi:MAG: BhlA/UviB family holin-like peptide [Clostridium septicum]|uniref:BhlA/UviB family holin-like peptide n=1 Tax=Clostridium septicum TaxID=1504 RepID=UPI0025867371|nr:BhlA/UviB family holin-like peptide [Clostridium septicum]MDU1313950.1 BhlA/UviB family holin-like peptide [Clostridium septicum]